MRCLNHQVSTKDDTPLLSQIIKLIISTMQSNAGDIHNRDDFLHKINPMIQVTMNANTKPKKQTKETVFWSMAGIQFGPIVKGNSDDKNKPTPNKTINR